MTQSFPTIVTVARWPVGGIRSYLRDLFTAPALREFRFVLVAPDIDDLKQYLADGNCGPVVWVPAGTSSGALARTLLSVCRAERPEFVHAQGFISGAIAAAVCTLARTPLLLTVHDQLLGAQFAGWKGHARKAIVGLSLLAPRYVHCVSHDSRSNLVGTYPWIPGLARRLVVIPHGVDVAKIQAAGARPLARELGCEPGTVIFGFLGRFMAPKGFRLIIDAVAALRSRAVSARQLKVLAVGSGGFIREDRSRIRSLGLDDYFVFWPYQADVMPILKGMDCMLMPSLWEASGLLAMEAMVAAVPVIGSDCIGLRETLADSPSVRIPANDAGALCDAMAQFLTQPDRQPAVAFEPEAARRFAATRAFGELRALYARIATAG